MSEKKENWDETKVFTGELVEEHAAGFPVPSAPLQRAQTQYLTAVNVQKPRNLDKVVAAVKREAALAGEAFYWSWPVKDKDGKKTTLDGPSIGLAMCVAREWTNVAVPVDYQETPTHDIFTAHFVDLERGFTVSRIWKQSKGANKNLSAWGERAVNMTFQAAQSRAIRNAVLAGVPKWLVDQAKEIAKESVLKGITPDKIAEARATIIKTMKELGVTEDQLVDAVGGVPVAQWGPSDIINLKGMRTQIRDGQASVDELFPPLEEKPKPEKKPAGRPKKEPQPEGRAPEKDAATTASEPPRGIQDETVSAIMKAQDATGISVMDAYQSLGIPAEIPLAELDEISGQRLLGWYKSRV